MITNRGITLDEAIKEIETALAYNVHTSDSTLERAMKLGIEALKREKKYRLPQFKGHVKLLPGETKE